MNIAFVFNHVLLPHLGGVERVTYRLSEYFKEKNNNIFFIYWQLGNQDEIQDSNIFFIPNSNKMFSKTNEIFLENVIKNNSIDVIINQMGFYNEISLLFKRVKEKVPFLLITVHHNLIFSHRIILYKKMYFRDVFTISKLKTSLKFYFFNIYDLYFKFRLSRKIIKQLKYNDYLVLLSKYFKNDLVKLIGEKNKSKILSISNPLSFNVRPESIKLNEKENQILYVGRFDSLQKRPDRLLEAWKLIQSHISDWQLILIGDGEQKIYLKKFIESNNLKNVTLKGFTDPTKYYYKSKILCLTSSYEGFGMVLTEAQQYGVVPIAFESYESIHDIIINERNGILIKPFSIKDYAKTLLHLMNDSSYRNYLAENALKDSQKFSLDEIGSQWLKLFQKK